MRQPNRPSTPNEPGFDSSLDCWVAVDLEGREVYGETRAACWERLREANEIIIKHRRKNERV